MSSSNVGKYLIRIDRQNFLMDFVKATLEHEKAITALKVQKAQIGDSFFGQQQKQAIDSAIAEIVKAYAPFANYAKRKKETDEFEGARAEVAKIYNELGERIQHNKKLIERWKEVWQGAQLMFHDLIEGKTKKDTGYFTLVDTFKIAGHHLENAAVFVAQGASNVIVRGIKPVWSKIDKNRGTFLMLGLAALAVYFWVNKK